MPTPDQRIGELAAIGRVDVGRDVASLADRQHREGVVEVPMRRSTATGCSRCSAITSSELSGDADARIDHDALLAGAGGDYPAVGVGSRRTGIPR